MQKLQNAALRQAWMKDARLSLGFRGPPKQAICPFCYKVFYDKSTMNRHVSKRVCLGLNFQTPINVKDEENTPTDGDVQSSSSLDSPSMQVFPINDQSSSSIDSPPMQVFPINDQSISCIDSPSNKMYSSIHNRSANSFEFERSSVKKEPALKSNRIPCPYCKKPMKGIRGVKKHIDFYGCPMAVQATKIDWKSEDC